MEQLKREGRIFICPYIPVPMTETPGEEVFFKTEALLPLSWSEEQSLSSLAKSQDHLWLYLGLFCTPRMRTTFYKPSVGETRVVFQLWSSLTEINCERLETLTARLGYLFLALCRLNV